MNFGIKYQSVRSNRKISFCRFSCSHNLECDYVCIWFLLNKKRSFLRVKAVWRWDKLSWKMLSSQFLEGFKLCWMPSISRWYRKCFSLGLEVRQEGPLLSFATRGSVLQREQEPCSLCYQWVPRTSHRVWDTIRCSARGHGNEWVTSSPYHPACQKLSSQDLSWAAQTQQCLHPPHTRRQGHQSPQDSLCRAPSRTCVAFESTASHLSSLFITLMFPFSISE